MLTTDLRSIDIGIMTEKRILAEVALRDGSFVNRCLVEHGYAQVMTVPQNLKYQDLFLKLLQEPKEQKRGLWR